MRLADLYKYFSAWGLNLVDFRESVFLITGGTGSFGNAMAERLLSLDAKEIRIFSRDEKKQEEMRLKFGDSRFRFFIGDVRDRDSLSVAMKGVDFVFQAAALKQVPACEFFPWEATQTNVLGTKNVLEVAIESGVGKVVCLSTDKAVYPVNAMGITKALMEKVAIAKSLESKEQGGTVICVTRYGNVMASRGSVIPNFAERIRKGQPLTVTNPNMTRFMMTLEDAVELVLFAFENADYGDIYVQKSPAAKVGDLAYALIDFLRGENVEIQTIGERHGEKLHESLLSGEEVLRTSDEGRYFKVSPDTRDLNYRPSGRISNQLPSGITVSGYSSDSTTLLSTREITQLLQKISF